MNSLQRILFFLVLIICLFPNKSFAQSLRFSKYFDMKDSTQVHLMETKDGSIFKGQVTNIIGDSMVFITQRSIVIKIHFKEVESVEVEGKDRVLKRSKKKRSKMWAQAMLEKQYRDENIKIDTFYPQVMFLHSTAFKPIPKGTRLYHNVDLYFNSWEYGLNNGFSVGIQAIPIALNIGAKYNHSFSEKLHVGVNANFINVFDFEDLFYGGDLGNALVFYPYGVITIGTPKIYLNATAGVSLPVITDSYLVGEERRAVYTLGGGGQEERFVYKASITAFKDRGYSYNSTTGIYSDFFFWSVAPTFSLGWQGKKNHIDLGVIFVVYEFAIPYLSLKRRLN